MKLIFFLVLMSLRSLNHTPIAPERITAQDLYSKIAQSSKPALIQFWVPNCGNKNNIVRDYKELTDLHGDAVDFYFVGITNLVHLITDVSTHVDYNYPLYYLGYDASIDLMERKERFAFELLKLMGVETFDDFNTLYIKELEVIHCSNGIGIDVGIVL